MYPDAGSPPSQSTCRHSTSCSNLVPTPRCLGNLSSEAGKGSHPADLANAGEGVFAQSLGPLHCCLPKEEEDFVIIRVLALWDPEDIHELGLWSETDGVISLLGKEMELRIGSTCYNEVEQWAGDPVPSNSFSSTFAPMPARRKAPMPAWRKLHNTL